MLVQFAVENYMSFKNEAVLNMTATTDSLHQSHVMHDEQGKKIEVLRAAALYGANASGKSNLIKAMAFAKNLIINGTRPDEPIFVVPFRLDPGSYKNPSKFEFIIKQYGVLYTYGFVADRQKIVEEWLLANFGKREVSLFERSTNKNGQVIVGIGSHMAPDGVKQVEFLKFVAQGTRPNQLFFSELYERNVEQIKPLMLWFRDILTILRPEQLEKNESYPFLFQSKPETYSKENLVSRLEEEPDLDTFMFRYLKTALKEIQFVFVFKDEKPKKSNAISQLLFNSSSNEKSIEDSPEEKEIHRELLTVHINRSDRDKPIPFKFNDESDGTQKLIQILPVIFDAHTKGKVFIIDELERSLHPHLSRWFLETFLNTEPFNGQIIFATHETTLMDLDLLRRDEIWFAEKDDEESSRIYSLAEFRVRTDLKIDKGYLNGRFGAIPFFGDANKIGIKTKPENIQIQ
jgi:uncharacterized protein